MGYGQKHNAGAITWKEGDVVVGSYSDELGAGVGEGALWIWGEFRGICSSDVDEQGRTNLLKSSV